jgi:hypothetical protein
MFKRKSAEVSRTITIVSGLPRSGTSMMMPKSEVGGQKSEIQNPKSEMLVEAQGKAVKVIAALLEYLPPGYAYRVIFMYQRMGEDVRDVGNTRVLDPVRELESYGSQVFVMIPLSIPKLWNIWAWE